VTHGEVLSSTETQTEFFYRVFPDQVEIGPNKSKPFYWLLSRTRDGSKKNAPRELIHLLNVLRDVQVKRFEIGDSGEPEKEYLFSRPATFKDALPEVSKVRLEQTLYAEYPNLHTPLEKLRNAKTSQTVETLAQIWGTTHNETKTLADELVEIGFFEQRITREETQYWVPFLYRDALDMIQGTAE
jgi:hypothetical protein